jgi:hypothetical protein
MPCRAVESEAAMSGSDGYNTGIGNSGMNSSGGGNTGDGQSGFNLFGLFSLF